MGNVLRCQADALKCYFILRHFLQKQHFRAELREELYLDPQVLPASKLFRSN